MAGCSRGVLISNTPHSPRTIVPLLAWAGAICTQITCSTLCPPAPRIMPHCFFTLTSRHRASRDFASSPNGPGSRVIWKRSLTAGKGRRSRPIHSSPWTSSCVTRQRRLNVGSRSSSAVCDSNLRWPRR
jgi:hypothetical protein